MFVVCKTWPDVSPLLRGQRRRQRRLRTHHGFERFERHLFVLTAATDADRADHLAAGALWSRVRQNVVSVHFEAMVGFTQPFFITPCDGRKLR